MRTQKTYMQRGSEWGSWDCTIEWSYFIREMSHLFRQAYDTSPRYCELGGWFS